MATNEVTKSELRVFGFLFAIALLAAPAVFCWLFAKSYPWRILAPVSAFFFLLGAFAPSALRRFRSLWLRFAQTLGWINTRILMGAFFWLCFTPIAWILRRRNPPLDLGPSNDVTYFTRVSARKSDMRKTY